MTRQKIIKPRLKNILTLFCLVIPLFVVAQKQGNIWYFGYGAGLDFNSGAPVNLTGGQTGSDFIYGYNNQEGTSCISDSSGNILMYTGGATIWNRNNSPMPNGTGIMGGVSSTQSSLIVPLPDSDSIFYVFTTDEFQSYTVDTPNPKGYRLSIVDICLDKNNGAVIAGQKNILLCDSSTEKLSACEDASGSGYWVLGHKMFSDAFYAWHLTSSGITDTVISKIGTIHGWHIPNSTWYTGAGQGQMKFNASGTKLALAISNFDPAYLDLFDFDNNTGIVSNYCHMVIDSALYKRIYSIEFSPDETKLYAALVGGSGGNRIYQYDLTAGGGDCNSIFASQFKLAQLSPGLLSGMQLAPNGKIYLLDKTANQLGCINYPNLTGLAANFDSLAITISNSSGGYSLPNFIAGYKYHNGISRCSTEGIGEIESNNNIQIYPNPMTNDLIIEVSEKSLIDILNINGQIIKSKYCNRKSTILDLTDLSSGVYIVRIKTDKKVITKKIIKE